MFRRVAQPPLNPVRRDPERHGFWPGSIVAAIGLGLVLIGAQRSTGLSTTDGQPARETELIRAFSHGGLQYADRMTPRPPPVPTGDPAVDAAALTRWDREQASAETPAWKLRVDPWAKTPCPT
jgi:hypothetical protein